MEYAAALLEVLERGDEQSRRLDRSIEWLAIAWRNEEAISLDVRILALRAGFEVLFGGGSSTQKHRAALHSLLDDQTAARRSRTWVDRGKEIHADLTDVEWWFQSFALLRNAIAHGDAISEADWSFEGQLHLWRGEHTLRQRSSARWCRWVTIRISSWIARRVSCDEPWPTPLSPKGPDDTPESDCAGQRPRVSSGLSRRPPSRRPLSTCTSSAQW